MINAFGVWGPATGPQTPNAAALAPNRVQDVARDVRGALTCSLLAEVDGNRTRQTRIARLGRFEGGGAHQVPRHLRLRRYLTEPLNALAYGAGVDRFRFDFPQFVAIGSLGVESRDCLLGCEGRQRHDGGELCDGVGISAEPSGDAGRPRRRLRHCTWDERARRAGRRRLAGLADRGCRRARPPGPDHSRRRAVDSAR